MTKQLYRLPALIQDKYYLGEGNIYRLRPLAVQTQILGFVLVRESGYSYMISPPGGSSRNTRPSSGHTIYTFYGVGWPELTQARALKMIQLKSGKKTTAYFAFRLTSHLAKFEWFQYMYNESSALHAASVRCIWCRRDRRTKHVYASHSKRETCWSRYSQLNKRD